MQFRSTIAACRYDGRFNHFGSISYTLKHNGHISVTFSTTQATARKKKTNKKEVWNDESNQIAVVTKPHGTKTKDLWSVSTSYVGGVSPSATCDVPRLSKDVATALVVFWLKPFLTQTTCCSRANGGGTFWVPVETLLLAAQRMERCRCVERKGFQTSRRIHLDDSFRSTRLRQMDGPGCDRIRRSKVDPRCHGFDPHRCGTVQEVRFVSNKVKNECVSQDRDSPMWFVGMPCGRGH